MTRVRRTVPTKSVKYSVSWRNCCRKLKTRRCPLNVLLLLRLIVLTMQSCVRHASSPLTRWQLISVISSRLWQPFSVHSVLWCSWLGGSKGIRSVKKLSGGVLVWLSVWSKIGFTFLVLAHPGSPGKRAVKRVCVCVFLSHSFSFMYRLWFVIVDWGAG